MRKLSRPNCKQEGNHEMFAPRGTSKWLVMALLCVFPGGAPEADAAGVSQQRACAVARNQPALSRPEALKFAPCPHRRSGMAAKSAKGVDTLKQRLCNGGLQPALTGPNSPSGRYGKAVFGPAPSLPAALAPARAAAGYTPGGAAWRGGDGVAAAGAGKSVATRPDGPNPRVPNGTLILAAQTGSGKAGCYQGCVARCWLRWMSGGHAGDNFQRHQLYMKCKNACTWSCG